MERVTLIASLEPDHTNEACTWIDLQIKRRLRSKYRWNSRKSGPLKIFMNLLKIMGYHLFGFRYRFARTPNTGELGVDEFGRDIGLGLRAYLKLLQDRGFKIRSLIVLGSRAKGTWTPKSDVDVLIILGSRPANRRRTLVDHPLYLGIQPATCLDTEFITWLNELRIAALDAMYYGIVAFDDGYWSEAKGVFSEIEKTYGLRRDLLLKWLSPL